MKVIFVLNETAVNSMCVCNFSVQIMYLEASCLLKNSSIEQRLVAGLEVHSGLCPVTNSHESVNGSKNKVGTNKIKPLSVHLSTASKLGV